MSRMAQLQTSVKLWKAEISSASGMIQSSRRLLRDPEVKRSGGQEGGLTSEDMELVVYRMSCVCIADAVTDWLLQSRALVE